MLMDKRSNKQQNTCLAKYIVQTINGLKFLLKYDTIRLNMDKKQSGVSFEQILLY